ncbi:MAG: hypothetical protein VX794_07945 [Nitrospinota bacterium]|nr:hypothetical protein [Nitrospinota bacterium]
MLDLSVFLLLSKKFLHKSKMERVRKQITMTHGKNEGPGVLGIVLVGSQ